MTDDYIEPEILMLIKSRIKQHQRKTKTGKITTVREHTDIRTKKMEEAKKNRGKGAKAEPKNSPAKIGRMLASRGVPISQNSKGKQVSGIAIRQSNNGKNIVMEYKDWENKGDRHTVMNQVRDQLKAVGLDISVKDGTEKYYIHTAGANFFGHGDFPDDKPKPKGSKESRAKMRESTAGIMDMLDRTHSEQAEASKKAEADTTQEKPIKGGDVGSWEDDAKKYKSAEEFINAQDIVYHGSAEKFETFDVNKIGTSTGTQEGRGFYFVDDKKMARGYMGKNADDSKVMEVALKIKKPLDLKQRKITDGQLRQIMEEVLKVDNEALANYGGDINYDGKEKVIQASIDIVKGNKTDLDIISDMQSSGILDIDGINKIFTKVTGYDGVKTKWRGGENITVAFYPEQIKTKKQLTDIWNKANPKKVKKSMLIKAKIGSQKPGHKYISRKGTAGDYDYKYKEPEQHSIFDKPKAKFTETKVLDLAIITPDPGQPREDFNETDLLTLGGSIRDLGLIQEIAVRPDPDDKTKFTIIAGERRYRASKLVGLTTIRSRIYNIQDPQAIYAIQVAENVGRKEMNPIETARAFKRLFDAGVSIESIALKVGTSPTTVKRKMMLITLTDAIQNLVKHGDLPLNQAYIIAIAELRPEYQNNVMRRLNAGKISTDALSGLVGKYKSAQEQTTLFGQTPGGLSETIHKTRLKSIERDTVKLIEEVGAILTRLNRKGGAKILPAVAKEKGKLAVVAKKIDMATQEMIKLNREVQRGKAFFEAGGSIAVYLKNRKIRKSLIVCKSMLIDIEKGRKYSVGHISTYRDGSTWKKVKNTGKDSDWVQVKAAPKERKQKVRKKGDRSNLKWESKAWREKYVEDYRKLATSGLLTPGMKKRKLRMEQLFKQRTGLGIKKLSQKTAGINLQIQKKLRQLSTSTIQDAQKQWIQYGVRSKYFKQFFGDWENDFKGSSKVLSKKGEPQITHKTTASSVIKEKGTPLVLYHGTHYGGFKTFDKNTVEVGLFGAGFYFTENKDVADTYKEKGNTVAYLGTSYYTYFNVQDPKNRTQINEKALELAKTNEDALVVNLKEIKHFETDPDGWRYATKGGLTRTRSTLKKRITNLKNVPNMTDAQLNTFLNSSRYRHTQYVEHDYHLYDWAKDNIPPLTPMTYEVYLNIRKPLDMDSKIPNAVKRQIMEDPVIVKMLADYLKDKTENVPHGFYFKLDAYNKNLNKVKNARTYVMFYGGMRQMTGKSTGFMGDSMDTNHANDILMQAFIKEGGYDGITHIGGMATGSKTKHRVWIALKSEQIKSVHNIGTFDKRNPEMKKSLLPKFVKLKKENKR